MKNFAVIFLLILSAAAGTNTSFAQETAEPQITPPAAAVGQDDSVEFNRALKQPTITERIEALKKFAEDFPESENRFRALEIIVSLRAELGDQKLRLTDLNGIELFKLAVREAPTPISDKLFTEILIQFPTNLFFRNQPVAAFEVAKLIEEKIGGNARQMLGLAAFYLGTEYASEGKRLAESAIANEPDLPAAYQTLGLASRINFDLDEAVKAYEKALELDPASVISRRSLAEMKRATGKSEEAIKLYREVLEAAPTDGSARTGLILSLFDAEERTEAEALMTGFLQTDPGNLFLLVGAAYWYAGHNEGARAVELAEKAIAIEPRYTWAHIALARGLMQQGRPLEAERTLLTAKQYGNFPTLDYEIAAARLAAGFFREAADELEKSFSIRDGLIETRLGGRIPRKADSFLELLSFERQASIFEPLAADNPQAAEKLKNLLRFSTSLSSQEPDQVELSEAVDEFVKGADNMAVHRRLFAANQLLDSRRGAAKALELTKDAIGEVDAALNVASPAAAVMADELYETRRFATLRNQYVLIPEIPIRTLSKILRGRIEELTARALFQQEKPDEALMRLNRAISVLPENSAWWRSSKWRLGTILESQGKPGEALEAYLAGYDREVANPARRGVIESLYQSINGNTEGLDELIGTAPAGETRTIIAVSNEKTGAEKESDTVPPDTEPATTTAIKIPENVPFLRPEPETTAAIKIPENVPFLRPEPTPEIIQPEANVETAAALTNAATAVAEPAAVNTFKPETNVETAAAPTNAATAVAEPAAVNTFKPETNLETAAASTNAATAVAEPAAVNTFNPETNVETAAASANAATADAEPAAVNIFKPETNNETPEVPLTVGQAAKTTPETTAREKPDKLSPNSLFEPIIIRVPKANQTDSGRNPVEKPIEFENKIADNTVQSEESPEEVPEKTEETNDTGAITRPRIVPETAVTLERAEEIDPCPININQEKISLLNDGGSLGMFVETGAAAGVDAKKLLVSSSSPEDIEAFFQTDIAVLSERAFLVIKSISARTGKYAVTLAAPCGKKEITVTVR